MTPLDSLIKDRLDRGIEPGDPNDVADQILARAHRRRVRRSIAKPVLAAAVIAASILGFVGLTTMFEGGDDGSAASGSTSTYSPPVQRPSLEAPLAPVPDAPAGPILFSGPDHRTERFALFTLDPRSGQVELIPGTDDLGGPAEAAWSPDGTRITFIRGDESGIFVMDADGSDVRRLTEFGTSPAWSPDGQQIAYVTGSAIDEPGGAEGPQINVMDADGSDQVLVGPGESPAWSPDGERLAYSEAALGGLAIMQADGSGLVGLGVQGYRPAWSPDGTKLAFVGRCGGPGEEAICTVDVDGTGLTTLVSASGFFADPAWSPDGSMIAFGYDLPEWEKTELAGGGTPAEEEVYLMEADGGGVYQLTDVATAKFRNSTVSPDWQP